MGLGTIGPPNVTNQEDMVSAGNSPRRDGSGKGGGSGWPTCSSGEHRNIGKANSSQSFLYGVEIQTGLSRSNEAANCVTSYNSIINCLVYGIQLPCKRVFIVSIITSLHGYLNQEE